MEPVFEIALTKAAPGDGAEIFARYRSLIGEPLVAWNDDSPAPENVRDDTASGSLYVTKLGARYCGRTAAYGHSFPCGEFTLNERV
jgi:hypothetical protein